MSTLRLALVQTDLLVGDIAGNAALIRRQAAAAAAGGAALVLFPEMALTGYPPEDLVLRRSFRQASRAALDASGRGPGHRRRAVVVGYLDDDTEAGVGGTAGGATGGARNASALLMGGRVVATYYKHHLPNYGVFDERRYFAAGDQFTVVRLFGCDIGLSICEDAWQEGGPFAVARAAGVGLVVNINGSPYELDKDDVRLDLLRRRAAEAGATIAYVNTVGGQDELVFDGDSMVVAADGTVLMRAPQYVEGIYYADVDVPPARTDRQDTVPTEGGPDMTIARVDCPDPAPARTAGSASPAPLAPLQAERISTEAEVWGALVTGLGDYVRKNGFRSVVLGVSGGIDSAVVAAIAADAIGGENVYGVSMPSAYSSDHSKSDAADLAERIGADYRVVPIAPMVDAFVEGLTLTGLAEENVQARVRGTTLMALSNAEGHLVLATGNKSELAVGYSTIYGDAVGGFAPLKDVPKSLVWRLARYRNEVAEAQGPHPADPAELDHQGALGRTAARTAGHRLVARLRPVGRDPGPLRRR